MLNNSSVKSLLKSIITLKFLGSVILLSTTLQTQATTVQQVTFAGSKFDISAFKQKQLGAAAIYDIQRSNTHVNGRLVIAQKSKGAIILLPGVNGLQQSHLDWALRLKDMGYSALVIDHYGSRNARNFKDLASVPTLEDTLGAAQFLTENNIATPDKIALLGFDRGASRTLAILSKAHPFAGKNVQFKAGVALYPNCASHRQFSAPVLMLAGENDHLMTMDTCKKLAQVSKSENRAVNFHILKGATHFFDDPAYRKPQNTADQPLWYASNHYSQQAHQQTIILIEKFLNAHLK